jgi:hypothetical protein
MLATLQFVIAMIACAISDRMPGKLDCSQEEVRLVAIAGSSAILG